MLRIKAVQLPSSTETQPLTIAALTTTSSSTIVPEAPPRMPSATTLLLLAIYALIRTIPYKQSEHGVTEGAKAGMAAVVLFFFTGILIASWMKGGTIPTLIYAGFELVPPSFYFTVVFIVPSIVGICVGSSLTTVGTLGVAFIGISGAIDVSLAITAGAIVSGAFFGDKMSPLSDTTNMASSILKVDLFTHIRNMGWTTIPAFVITLVLFGIMSPEITTTDFSKME